MLKIHHLHQSRSERIVWLAEELGLDYQLVKHRRDPQTMRSPPSLWAVSPLGKSPVIEDGSVTVFESGAIIEYLLDRYGAARFRPAADRPELLRYRQWMHCAESTLLLPGFIDLLTTATQSRTPALTGFVEGEYRTLFAYLNKELGVSGYVAGREFTTADIMVAYTLWLSDGSAVSKLGSAVRPLFKDYPHIEAYAARMRERPAHMRALARMED